jgi:RimJ/RimL family protein N-acetyltransferase
MQGRTLPTFEQYVRELDRSLGGSVVTMLMIEPVTDAHPIGFVFAYDNNPFDKYLYWTIALHPAFTHAGWGAEAAVLFLNYLFTYFDIRMAYSDHFAFNFHSARLLLRTCGHEEGRFIAQRYYQGAFHDVIRISITREDWYRAVKERLGKFLVPRHLSRSQAGQGQSAPEPSLADVPTYGGLSVPLE